MEPVRQHGTAHPVFNAHNAQQDYRSLLITSLLAKAAHQELTSVDLLVRHAPMDAQPAILLPTAYLVIQDTISLVQAALLAVHLDVQLVMEMVSAQDAIQDTISLVQAVLLAVQLDVQRVVEMVSAQDAIQDTISLVQAALLVVQLDVQLAMALVSA
jgi:hypothetical protein